MNLFKRVWYRIFPPEKLELPGPEERWLEGMTPDRIRVIYRRIFSSSGGRVILADLEAKYGNRSTVVRAADDSIDPLDMAVREGERRVLLRIKNLIKEDS